MEKEINLLPDRYKNAGYKKRLRRTRITVLAFVAVAAVLAFYTPYYMIDRLKSMNTTLENQVSLKGDAENYVRIHDELQKEIGKRKEIIKGANSKNRKWSELVDDIGRRVPEGLALRSISCGKENTIGIEGQASAYSLVAGFLVRLQNIEGIAEASPVSLVQGESGYYEFDIECRLQDGSDYDETQ